MYDVRVAVSISEVYVLFAQQSRGRRNLSMVRPTSQRVSFVFAVLFLRVKSVATKHGLGNFSKEVLSHDKAWAWEQRGSSHRMVLGQNSKDNGLAGTCRASAQFATSVREDINCRTKHLGAYCVSYVSKKSVGRISARMDCGNMFRQFRTCCVLCARGNVLAVGAKSVSERETSTEIPKIICTKCVGPVSTQRVPSVAQREGASGLQTRR